MERTTAARIPAKRYRSVSPAPMQTARPDAGGQRHDQDRGEVEIAPARRVTQRPYLARVHLPLLGVQRDGGRERAGGRRRFFIQPDRLRQVRVAVRGSPLSRQSYPLRRGINRPGGRRGTRERTGPGAGPGSALRLQAERDIGREGLTAGSSCPRPCCKPAVLVEH